MLETLQRTRRVVIKLGTNILRAEDGQLDTARLTALSAEIAALRARGLQVVVVSSGAVGLGMGRLGWAERPTQLPRLQLCAAVGQSILTETWQQGFRAHGITVAQVLLTGSDILQPSHNRIFGSFLDEVLAQGVVPIVNENDSVSTDGFRLGDNDSLSALMACRIRAQLLIILSTIPGLMDKPEGGKLIPRIDHITPEIEALAGGALSATSVGGMITKLRAARLACAFGCGVFIGSGHDPSILSRILDNRAEGTFFSPRASTGKSRRRLTSKRWRAHFGEAAGTLHVDAGAANALLEAHRSLLARGITEVNGSWKKHDVLDIRDPHNRLIARGLAEFDSETVRAIAGKKSEAILDVMPHVRRTEVVHRDGLLILS